MEVLLLVVAGYLQMAGEQGFRGWRQTLNRIPLWLASGPLGGIIGSAFSRIIRPSDPNDILGPAGFGEEKWITASSTLPYTIRFENQASATAPAQQVVITQQLDPDLDFRTYRVGDFGWGDLFFDVPDNRAFYNDRLDLTATKGYYVDVTAGIDITKGEAFWTITTIDPETGEIPEDALAGFLPPNNEDGVGDGFVNYSIRTRRDVQTGAVIDAEARIVFDTEEPIDTPPIFNTIDTGAPSSTVNALPATTETAEFLVNWSGSDDNNGSALANYTIYVSDNGSTFTPWLENTTLTEATYIGESGHTYAFYSVARDNAGNSQAVPTTAQATIQVIGGVLNITPVLALNQGLTLNEQATGAIANTQLQVTDVDNSTTQVTYTLTDIPDNGTLLRNNLALAINDTFTQADIDTNLLNYTHNASETTSDSFSFTVADGAGGAIANTTFNITVNPVNDNPILGSAIADQTATEETAFSFQIPANTFTDVDAGDTLTYTATLDNGDALPTWLTFDAATRTFSGIPANADITTLNIKVTATDNSGASVNDIFTLTVANINNVPTLVEAIADQNATQDSTFSFTIPENTFSDSDAGDTLTYTATNENGDALPSWLTFDAATRTFSGTPANADVAALNIKVTATDNSGAGVDDIFTITVTNTNDAPTLVEAIANQAATEDSTFSFTIPENTFSDSDLGDSLTYSATLENGDALPTWLTFDAATRTFNGTPANADVAALNIKVTATDNSGASVNDIFTLTVANINNVPTLSNAIANQSTTEDTAFTFAIPENTFSDSDAGDSLTYTATLENGDALPTWLTFDAATGTFSGTPANNDVATLSIKVTATDNFGSSVDDIFTLTVANTNDAPILGVAIADQIATQDSTFSFTIPENTFSDSDAGDTLTYTATNENGDALPTDALPAWLSFDAATRTFNGIPSNSDVSAINIKVTATDNSGESVNNTFTLTIANTNDAPTLVQTIADQTVIQNTVFSFTIAANTFSDVDAGDILTYSATLENGEALPSWLTFDAATRTFSGTPNSDNVGIFNIKVVASDIQGATEQDIFALTVTNVINGTEANETLTGGAGNDILDGGAGSDRLLGGTGNDTYIVDTIRDVVIENAGAGEDTVQSAVNYTLTANVEYLILTGTANITGTGNDLDNSITGNIGENLLKGLGGNDTLLGNAGDDTLIGGAGNDLLTGGEGSDRFLFGSGATFTNTSFGVDTLTDFVKGIDKIALSKTSFNALSSTFNAAEFSTINTEIVNEATVASASSGKIVYNLATGNLLYNPNGSTAGLDNGGLFATLTGIPNLDTNDIMSV